MKVVTNSFMFISPFKVCDSKCEVSSVNRSGDLKALNQSCQLAFNRLLIHSVKGMELNEIGNVSNSLKSDQKIHW